MQNSKFNINIILPFFPKKPGGGVKIMYEYADRLSLLGHNIIIYHVNNTRYINNFFLLPFRYLYHKIRYKKFIPIWYTFSSNKISFKYIWTLSNKNIKDADATISTWWSLAYDLIKLNDKKGVKINFIQDHETWAGYVDKVQKSYSLPVIHVTTSDFLEKLIYDLTKKKPHKIYYGFDNIKFKIINKIEERNPFSICFMYSNEVRKGSKYGIKALQILKDQYPQLTVDVFSAIIIPNNLNLPWINFHLQPKNLPLIYNRNAIFITSSIKEGWGMPATEAMFCGCAVVATNIEGHLTFVKNMETGITCNPGNEYSIVESTQLLLNNHNLRVNIANNGNLFVQQFDWGFATQKMVSIIQANL